MNFGGRRIWPPSPSILSRATLQVCMTSLARALVLVFGEGMNFPLFPRGYGNLLQEVAQVVGETTQAGELAAHLEGGLPLEDGVRVERLAHVGAPVPSLGEVGVRTPVAHHEPHDVLGGIRLDVERHLLEGRHAPGEDLSDRHPRTVGDALAESVVRPLGTLELPARLDHEGLLVLAGLLDLARAVDARLSLLAHLAAPPTVRGVGVGVDADITALRQVPASGVGAQAVHAHLSLLAGEPALAAVLGVGPHVDLAPVRRHLVAVREAEVARVDVTRAVDALRIRLEQLTGLAAGPAVQDVARGGHFATVLGRQVAVREAGVASADATASAEARPGSVRNRGAGIATLPAVGEVGGGVDLAAVAEQVVAVLELPEAAPDLAAPARAVRRGVGRDADDAAPTAVHGFVVDVDARPVAELAVLLGAPDTHAALADHVRCAGLVAAAAVELVGLLVHAPLEAADILTREARVGALPVHAEQPLGRARIAAAPAVSPIGLDIRARTAAVRLARLAGGETREEGADAPLRTGVAATAAVLPIGGDVRADVAAAVLETLVEVAELRLRLRQVAAALVPREIDRASEEVGRHPAIGALVVRQVRRGGEIGVHREVRRLRQVRHDRLGAHAHEAGEAVGAVAVGVARLAVAAALAGTAAVGVRFPAVLHPVRAGRRQIGACARHALLRVGITHRAARPAVGRVQLEIGADAVAGRLPEGAGEQVGLGDEVGRDGDIRRRRHRQVGGADRRREIGRRRDPAEVGDVRDARVVAAHQARRVAVLIDRAHAVLAAEVEDRHEADDHRRREPLRGQVLHHHGGLPVPVHVNSFEKAFARAGLC